MRGRSGLTSDNLESLNLLERRQNYPRSVERKVDEYLLSLDKRTRSQLSRTQLIKSNLKVLEWKKELNKNSSKSGASSDASFEPVTKEWLEKDYDPALFHDYKDGRPPTQRRRTPALTGQKFEKDVYPNLKVDEATLGRRHIKMKEYLARRRAQLNERDKMRKIILTLQRRENIEIETLLKLYHKKRRDLQLSQLRHLYNMEDNEKMSTNELLAAYREEIPLDQSGRDDDTY